MNGMTRQASIAKSQVFNNSLRNSLMNDMAADIPLDGSAEDIWNHNTSITTIATPTAQTTSNCVQNTCYSFDGTGAFILADNAKYVVTNQMTAMIWVKGNAQATKSVFSHWGIAANREWQILTGSTNGYLNVVISDDGGTTSTKTLTTSSAAPFDGNWHLVGFTLAAGTTGNLTLYVDGVSAAASGTDGTITAIDDTTAPLSLGCSLATNTTCTGGTFFTGLLDSARFYNAVIPTSQIKELYFAGLNNLFAKGQITAQEYSERISSVGINN
jgi:hypothetical protein